MQSAPASALQTATSTKLQTLFTQVPLGPRQQTAVAKNSLPVTHSTLASAPSATAIAPSSFMKSSQSAQANRKILMSAATSGASQSTPLATGQTLPVAQGITMDNLLDMQLPLKSLQKDEIQKAFAQQMQGRHLQQDGFWQAAPVKQTGVDMDSLLDWQLAPKTKTLVPPSFKTAQPINRITTDDLLDMQFPLKSLESHQIQKAYMQAKMKGKPLTHDYHAPNTDKIKGIDMDSLLDSNIKTKQGYMYPSNVIISEIDAADKDKASDWRKKAGFSDSKPSSVPTAAPQTKIAEPLPASQGSRKKASKQLIGFSSNTPTIQMSAQSSLTATTNAAYTINKHEYIVPRDIDMGNYQI